MRRVFWIALLGILVTPAVARAQGEEVVYYHTDAIGSVRMITDPSGTVLARYDYTPFGQPWNPPGTVEAMQFAGKERELQDGNLQDVLDHFLARDFLSFTGRFTTPDDPAYMDPFNPQSMNRFAYAHNNPFRWVDPTGHQICPTVYCEYVNVTAPRPDELESGLLWFLVKSWVYVEDHPRAWGFVDGSTQTIGTLFTSPTESCLSAFAAEVARNVAPFPMDSNPSAGDVIGLVGEIAAPFQLRRAWQYAASRPNYLGGQGLIYANKSSVFRNMLGKSRVLGNGALVGVESFAIFGGLRAEWQAAASGKCR